MLAGFAVELFACLVILGLMFHFFNDNNKDDDWASIKTNTLSNFLIGRSLSFFHLSRRAKDEF